MKKFSLLFLLCVLSLGTVFLSSSAVVHPALAMTMRKGESVTIGKNELIDESVFLTGSTIVVNGTVQGDLVCAGKSVTISGTIHGDVLCAAQDLEITGIVDGNIRVVGQNITIAGDVDRSLMVAGQRIVIAKTATVSGEVLSAGQAIKLDGKVAKNFMAAGEQVTVNGVALRSLQVYTKQLYIGDTASISGQVKYVSEKTAIVDSHATVANPLIQETPKPEMKKNMAPKTRHFSIFPIVFSAICTFVLGWIFLQLFTKPVASVVETLVRVPVASALAGAIVLFGGPIVFVLLLLTIIGIPLAFVWLLVWILVLMCSSALVAIALGSIVAKRYWKTLTTSQVKQLLVGSLILAVACGLPVVGWIGSLCVTVLGSGALIRTLLDRKA